MGEKRKLDDDFIQALKFGELSPILSRVKKDQTLDFQIRSNEAHIYYRGGRLLQIKKIEKAFSCYFDANYCKGQNITDIFPKQISSSADAELIVKAVPVLKEIMDFFFAEYKDKSEREFQQLIVRENNYSNFSNASDYFIADIEYAIDSSRFDLMAIKWESDGRLRQKSGTIKSPPRLSICELKYYTQALEGKAGLLDHVNDVLNVVFNPEKIAFIKDDVLGIFKQKRELELVRFGAGGNENSIDALDESIELILMLANYDPECSKLENALNSLSHIDIPNGLELKIAVSNFMGYGLFKEGVYDLNSFQQKFASQISSQTK